MGLRRAMSCGTSCPAGGQVEPGTDGTHEPPGRDGPERVGSADTPCCLPHSAKLHGDRSPTNSSRRETTPASAGVVQGAGWCACAVVTAPVIQTYRGSEFAIERLAGAELGEASAHD